MNANTILGFESYGAAVMGELRSALGVWRARRVEVARIRSELQSYSDRELCDLGISRADIPGIAASTWRRF